MEVEELHSGIQGEFHPAPLGASDMEAVEALMSMTKHCENFRFKYSRPLTPSSDCSEDDCAHLGSTVLQESPLVSVAHWEFQKSGPEYGMRNMIML